MADPDDILLTQVVENLMKTTSQLVAGINEMNCNTRDLAKITWRLNKIFMLMACGLALLIIVLNTIGLFVLYWMLCSHLDYRADRLEHKMIHQEVHIERGKTHEEWVQERADKIDSSGEAKKNKEPQK